MSVEFRSLVDGPILGVAPLDLQNRLRHVANGRPDFVDVGVDDVAVEDGFGELLDRIGAGDVDDRLFEQQNVLRSSEDKVWQRRRLLQLWV